MPNTVSLLRQLDSRGNMAIFCPQKEDKLSEAYYLMLACRNLGQSVYVRGEDNVAIFAAKVMSAYNADLNKTLKDMAETKAQSYPTDPLNIESFIGGK